MIRTYLFLIWFLCILSLQSFSQNYSITVDEEKLSTTLQAEVNKAITEKITELVQTGEQELAKATYFNIVLEPFKRFGIDPDNPDFLKQIYDIHTNINKELEKDPSLRRSVILAEKIDGLMDQGMKNYVASYIDNESKEIYSQVSDLITNGKEKISGLLDAASGISAISDDDKNYESKVTAVLRNYGITSDYFFYIDDLNQVLSQGYDKVKDPVSALSTIVSATRSNDPVYKIESLLNLGETYGGRIPIIGEMIKPIFTMGKGVLDAAKGLENVLERNLNQGCISPAGGTYASANPNKRTSFIQKFPEVDRACPMNDQVYSPVYNNIYFNTSNSQEIFFYMSDNWFRGQKDPFHKGQEDIFNAIKWLRAHNSSDKAVNLEFMYVCYQKEFGWTVYTDEVSYRLNRIRTLFLAAYKTVSYCEQSELESFFMDRMGLNWLSRLMLVGNREFAWNDLKQFTIDAEQEIVDQMIANYYLSKHHDNLDRLDQIIFNLENNVPINIWGKVVDGQGMPVNGARLEPGTNSMFNEHEACQRVSTSSQGTYSFFILMNLNRQTTITVSATLPDQNVLSENQKINPLVDRYYEINLSAPYSSPSDEDRSEADSNSVDIGNALANSDCANDPKATPFWDELSQQVICDCIDGYLWNSGLRRCEPNIAAILAGSDCSQWPNTEPKWDYDREEPYCDCRPGYQWNEDFTLCLSLQEIRVSQADCSQYPNSRPVWDPVNNEVVCECIPGFEWNQDYTACISLSIAATQQYDCSGFPNTEAIWDPVSQQVYCDCVPGYEWNDDFTGCLKNEPISQQVEYDCSGFPNSQPVFDPVANEIVCDCMAGYEWNNNFTACVPIRNRPNVDWDAIIGITMDAINAANGLANNGNTGGVWTSPGYPSTAQQPAVSHNSNCNDQQQAGGDAPEVHNINLGQSYGSFSFDYNVFNIKDQIIITQGGQTIFNSGCISGSKKLQINLNGFSSQISVRVNPNCDGNTSNTEWNFTVHCPNQ